MTTHPEDAMTRERAMEEALTAAKDALEAIDAEVLLEGQVQELSSVALDKIETALASAEQEPAPAADVEEASRIWFAGCVGFPTMQSREAFRAGWLAHEAAALRRYAGDR